MQLARIAQDDSPDLQVTASTLAEVVELGDHHQIAPEIREPVSCCSVSLDESTRCSFHDSGAASRSLLLLEEFAEQG